MKIPGKLLSIVFCAALIIPASMPAAAHAQAETPGFSLRLIVSTYDRVMAPGEENILHLEIRNLGDEPVTDIRLSSEYPEDWKVEIVPSIITSLAPGDSRIVDIGITLPSNVSRDGYTVNFIADSNEGREIVSAYLRTDPPTTVWTWIGIAIGAVVIAGFVYVYRRFGRQ